jgi:hypothetical protein
MVISGVAAIAVALFLPRCNTSLPQPIRQDAAKRRSRRQATKIEEGEADNSGEAQLTHRVWPRMSFLVAGSLNNIFARLTGAFER